MKNRRLPKHKNPPPPPPKGKILSNSKGVALDKTVEKEKPTYRILQTSDKSFEVQKLFKETTAISFLFWKKNKVKFVYHTIDDRGRKCFINARRIYSRNFKDLLVFKTLEKAKKAIQDLKTYPIIHEIYKGK